MGENRRSPSLSLASVASPVVVATALTGCWLTSSLADLGPTSDSGSPSAYAAVVLADEPVAYYRLDDVAPSATAKDASHHGHDGTYTGSGITSAPGAVTGDTDGAAQFTGEGYVRVGAGLEFAGTSPFSIEAWVKTTLDSQYHGVVTCNDGVPPSDGYLLYVPAEGNGASAVFQRVGSPTSASAGGTFNGSGFVHWVGVFANGQVALYLDGEQVSARPAPLPMVGADAGLVLGAESGGAFGAFVGVLDEVAIYDEALGADRIMAHYLAGVGRQP